MPLWKGRREVPAECVPAVQVGDHYMERFRVGVDRQFIGAPLLLAVAGSAPGREVFVSKINQKTVRMYPRENGLALLLGGPFAPGFPHPRIPQWQSSDEEVSALGEESLYDRNRGNRQDAPVGDDDEVAPCPVQGIGVAT